MKKTLLSFAFLLALFNSVIASEADPQPDAAAVLPKKRPLEPVYDIEELRGAQDRQRSRLGSAYTPASAPRPKFIFTAEQRASMLDAGLSEELIDKIAFLSTALIRSPHGMPKELSSYFSDDEINTIETQLEALDEFSLMLTTLKDLYPKKVVLRDVTNTDVWSPTLRIPLSRDRRSSFGTTARKLNMEGIKVKCLATNAQVFKEPEPAKETSEQRSARLALQADIFASIERARGVSAAAAGKALSEEEARWKEFKSYFTIRTAEIDSKAQTTKITKAELEDVFERYVADHYSKFTVDDCTLYVRLDEIDPKRTNFIEETNLDLLARGIAPIGADGKPMNLHHLTRRHPGIIVLISETLHQSASDVLHLKSARHMRQPDALERRIFNPWKIRAWKLIHEELTKDPDT